MARVKTVLVRCYCPACRQHWFAQVAEAHVRAETRKGHGFPFHKHPACLARQLEGWNGTLAGYWYNVNRPLAEGEEPGTTPG